MRLLSLIIMAGGIGLAVRAAPLDGEQLFKRQCAVCHSVQPERTLVGPSLAKVIDRPAGIMPSFRYSPSMRASGLIWDRETINAFIESPRAMISGTNMAFPGEHDPAKRAAIVDYLSTLQ